MGNIFLDAPTPRGSKYVQTPLQGRVIEQYAPGFLQVDVEGSLIDVAAVPGVYGVGAMVTVERGLDGRPTRVVPPQSLPDGVEPLGVGVTGETTLEAKTTADQAAGDALDALDDAARASNAAADALSEAQKAWDEASAARENIAAVDSSARAAQAVADAAQAAAALNQLAIEAAQEAQELENARIEGLAVDADAKADAAQATADALYLQSENKVPNWSFETGYQPWGSNFGLNASHIVDVSDAWHGAKVVQRTIGSSAFHWIFLPFDVAVPTEPGRVWEARARVRTVGGEGRAYAGFRAYQANGEWAVPGIEVPGLVDGQWETITSRYKSTSAAVRVTPLIGVAAEHGTVFQIDAVELRDVTEADAAQARADELAEQAQAAMTAAQQAQTSADGKALVAYSDYQPATIAGQKIIWFEPGSVPMLFDGEEWRSVQPGDGVVEALDIGTATVGELSGMRIKAGTASVDILIPGENARWTSSGLTIYHPLTPEQQQAGVDPTDWDNRSVALNLTSDSARFISVADEAGTVTAYMSPQGEVSGRELTITGQAAVDTLQVGGLDLNEVISLNSSLAAYSVIPALVHPEGFAQVIVAQTGWQAFPPGLYMASWPVSYLLTRQDSRGDAMGAYLALQKRPAGSNSIIDTDWESGDRQATSWASSVDGIRYGSSNPIGVFEAEEDTEYRFSMGLHSYLKWRLAVEPSVFKVERLNPALELSHNVYNQSSPTPPPTPVKTASVGLSDLWYAYGNTFAQSGSYQSGGNFRIPDAKGKQIISIRVTGRCNFDFVDGGAGAYFSFHLGGENRSQKIYDYGAVDITYGATAGATLSSQGYVGFRLNNGAPAYNEYNAGSFRCTVTYQ